MKYNHVASVSVMVAAALSVSACSILSPDESELSADNIEVSRSEAPSFEAEDVQQKEVTSNLGAPQKDEGLGVTWQLQGLFADNVQGTVVTILVKNDNDKPVPPEAIEEPTLERADGNGGWADVELLPYDENTNADVASPGLDAPLGENGATNLQYRFDVAPGNLWNARLSIGNVTWSGDLNI
ncbi:hypothetical protein [Corynebacterium camporealensis]